MYGSIQSHLHHELAAAMANALPVLGIDVIGLGYPVGSVAKRPGVLGR